MSHINSKIAVLLVFILGVAVGYAANSQINLISSIYNYSSQVDGTTLFSAVHLEKKSSASAAKPASTTAAVKTS